MKNKLKILRLTIIILFGVFLLFWIIGTILVAFNIGDSEYVSGDSNWIYFIW